MAEQSTSPAEPRFSVDVYQNEFLPQGGTEVNAIVTVAASGGSVRAGVAGGAGTSGGSPGAAVVIMVDCSGSMRYPMVKMDSAREATAAAIGAVRDGVAFAVVAGTHRATEVYPGDGGLATAGPATRAAAREALAALKPGGGTAIGTWLSLADRLLATSDARLRHGILVTDGRNEHEEPERLRQTLAECAGRFTCDARGVGTDWAVAEVRQVAAALLGSADIVAEPAGLAADFTAMMEAAMGKEVPDVELRLWTPAGAEPLFVKQVAPSVEDLTHRRTETGPRVGAYPTGSWGEESRDYHISVRVPAAEVGQEMLAGRVTLTTSDDEGLPLALGQGLIRAVWTDDTAVSTRMSPQVAHYTGQAELAEAIQDGLELRKSGDRYGATAKLGRAVQLAHRSGDAATARLLAKVVEVEDAANGTVRLKATVSDADEMTLETRSTKTVRVKR
ncbi:MULTISPECIES: VWA domain-containing protein [unclassified Streptomyces]|uniref:vWA domain-containing protein n=1 Tax=unclassified Streptomyces TaxID=2593676 RepID=UPI000CD519EE|nr:MULTISPECIES: VWA domain-containing protein [unclassified Streptomyces]